MQKNVQFWDAIFLTRDIFKEIKFCTEIMGKLYSKVCTDRLTWVIICYGSQVSVHVALYHTGFLGIVKIHFRKKKLD